VFDASTTSNTSEPQASGLTRRERLRAQTSEVHRQLDQWLDASGGFTRADAYRGFIAGMARFYGAAIHTVGPSLVQVWPGWSRWNPLDALMQDAAALRVLPPVARLKPDFSSAAAQLGLLYVVVGSSLGARVLVRRVRELPAPVRDAGHYLAHLDAERWAWPDFVETLESAHLDEAAELQLLSGALSAFTAVTEHLRSAMTPSGRL